MQHCSLQHRTLLSPPETSTTEYFFCFGPATSFLLELFVIVLCSFPVAYRAPSNWGWGRGAHIFLAFHTVHGILQERILEWVAISFFSGPYFVRTLHILLGWPYMAWFIASLSYTRPFATVETEEIKKSWEVYTE